MWWNSSYLQEKIQIYLRVILPKITGVIMVIINGNKLILSIKDGVILDDLLIWQMLFLFGFIMSKTTWNILSLRALIGFKILPTNQTSKPLVHTWRNFLKNPERKSTHQVRKLSNLNPSLGIYIAMHCKK